MGVFSRLSDIINSNINSMLDKAEDPEKIARLIIQEMEDCLVEVRSAAARSMADKKEYERDIKTLEQTRLDWTAKAELAVEKGREDLARGALSAKQRAEREIDSRRQALTAVRTIWRSCKPNSTKRKRNIVRWSSVAKLLNNGSRCARASRSTRSTRRCAATARSNARSTKWKPMPI